MPTLPDIDTNGVSYIAYWNAIDQGGASDIAPEETTSQANIVESTLYDNGIEATYQTNTAGGREVTIRVKSDGWFVAYMDRTKLYAVDEQDFIDIRGTWDIASDWAGGGAASIVNNSLERAINALYQELSNSGSINYNVSDVGLYNYNTPDATNISVASAGESQEDTTNSFGFVYTEETNRLVHDLVARATDYEGFVAGAVRAPWDTIIAGRTSTSNAYDDKTAIDIIGDGRLTSANTEYTTEHYHGNEFDTSNEPTLTSHAHIIQWN